LGLERPLLVQPIWPWLWFSLKLFFLMDI
jgi:hypothetical protein